LRDEVQFELACQLLRSTTIPTGQIASIVGYSESSSFNRAFKRWAGVPPRRVAAPVIGLVTSNGTAFASTISGESALSRRPTERTTSRSCNTTENAEDGEVARGDLSRLRWSLWVDDRLSAKPWRPTVTIWAARRGAWLAGFRSTGSRKDFRH